MAFAAAVQRDSSLQIFKDAVDSVTPSNLVDDELSANTAELDATSLHQLFCYRVPVTLEEGACAASKDLDPVPFDLGLELFGSADWAAQASGHAITIAIQRLGNLVRALAARTQVDWLGVYLLRTRSDGFRYLVKLAYFGRPSRAIFPLNELFHGISNNSWVAMEGRPRLIQDVGTYDGPYYACDGDVQSELCAPIFDETGKVLGIIDAESFQKTHFNAQRAADVLQACADLGRRRLGLPSALC